MSAINHHTGGAPADLKFAYVDGASPYFKKLEQTFRSDIEPIYGNQDAELEEIKKNGKRRCEVLLNYGDPVAFIVYKKANERLSLGSKTMESFKVKHFGVMDGKPIEAYGSILVRRVIKLAEKNFAQGVHMSLSARNQKTIDFLRKKDFSIQETDENVQGAKRYSARFNIPEKIPEKVVESRKQEPIQTVDSRKRRREESPVRNSHASFDECPSAKRRETEEDYWRHKNQSNVQSNSQCNSLVNRTPKFPLYSNTEKQHELTLKAKYIHQIQSGHKTIEGRINSGIVLKYRHGDKIRFFYQQNPADDAVCKIIAIRKYRDFKEMLEREGYQKCLTDVTSFERAVDVYDQIPGYANRAAQNGVAAIQLELLPRR